MLTFLFGLIVLLSVTVFVFEARYGITVIDGKPHKWVANEFHYRFASWHHNFVPGPAHGTHGLFLNPFRGNTKRKLERWGMYGLYKPL